MIRITLALAAMAIVLLVPATSGADEGPFGTCPDGYQATPFLASPQDDRNGNGIVCVKFVGSHENTHDDPNGRKYRCNGFPTPPPECITDPDGSFFVLDDTL